MSVQGEQLQRLVDELLAATLQGRADWRAFGPGLTYRLERPSGTVILARRLDHDHVLEFLDSNGEKILSHTESLMADSLFSPSTGAPLPPGALQRLFDAVQHSLARPRPEVESFLREL